MSVGGRAYCGAWAENGPKGSSSFKVHHDIGKIEKGDLHMAMDHYSTALFVTGMADRLEDLADPETTTLGFNLKKSGCRSEFALRTKRKFE